MSTIELPCVSTTRLDRSPVRVVVSMWCQLPPPNLGWGGKTILLLEQFRRVDKIIYRIFAQVEDAVVVKIRSPLSLQPEGNFQSCPKSAVVMCDPYASCGSRPRRRVIHTPFN